MKSNPTTLASFAFKARCYFCGHLTTELFEAEVFGQSVSVACKQCHLDRSVGSFVLAGLDGEETLVMVAKD